MKNRSHALATCDVVRRKRIALVVPSLEGGGGVPSVADFICRIIEKSGKYDYQLISLSMSSRDPLSVGFSLPASWCEGVRSEQGVWMGRQYTRVGAFVSEFEFQRYRPRAVLTELLADCNVIQMICGSPAWANAVCGLDKPVAVHTATRVKVERRHRDSQPQGLWGWWRKAMTKITDRLDDRGMRAVDAVQVMNPWMLQYARQLNVGRHLDLRYAPPGIDAQALHPLPHRDLIADPYILCVARLSDPRKNLGLLLDAYARLPQQLIDRVRLVMAGSSAPPESFWQRANALGLRERVSYVQQPDRQALISLYQNATVFALPSNEEGFGMVLIEAMACGVPVISTRSGGPDGIITHSEDGYLVSLDDAQALATHLATLLDDPTLNLRMGQHARQTIEQRYAEEVAGRAFIDTWERLLKK
ncbi:MAG: glycosyltransferase family 4 protein [Pseudomonas sp.]